MEKLNTCKENDISSRVDSHDMLRFTTKPKTIECEEMQINKDDSNVEAEAISDDSAEREENEETSDRYCSGMHFVRFLLYDGLIERKNR